MYEGQKHGELTPTILALQQKLKQRKQLDYDIEQLMTAQLLPLYGRSFYPDYPHDRLYGERVQHEILRDRLMRLEPQYPSYYPTYDPPYSSHHQPKQPIQTQHHRLLADNHRYQLAGSPQKAGYISYDDEALLRKYQDGTRAKQYTQQIENYDHGVSSRKLYDEQIDNIPRPVNRSLANQFQRIPPPKQDVNPSPHQARSPYARLSDTQEKGFQQESPQKAPFPQNKKFSEERPKHDSTTKKHLQRAEINFMPKALNFNPMQAKMKKTLNISHFQRQLEKKSPYYKNQSHSKRKESNSKRKTNRSQRKTASVSKLVDRSVVRSVQADALKKIQNRLKLSEVIFEDSKYRNVKHELSHLQMTFQNEKKCRKDIKDKLNNHPLILRKHAMVV